MVRLRESLSSAPALPIVGIRPPLGNRSLDPDSIRGMESKPGWRNWQTRGT